MQFKDRTVVFDSPKVMGILNVTPDSFSDGGKYTKPDKALIQASSMVQQGAAFIDVGGESTRPGACEVSLQQELDRVIPVIEAIHAQIDTIITIDTSKPEVMEAAVEAGASMINDVRALSMPMALETAAALAVKHKVPTCIMHMQGTPITMQDAPKYHHVIDDIIAFFKAQIERLTIAGFTHQQLILDPGFGFGKSVEHNFQILKHFAQFTQLDLPLLAGISRKSMIGNVLDRDVNARLAGDTAANTIAGLFGASIIRVHDVEQACDAMKIVNKINSVI